MPSPAGRSPLCETVPAAVAGRAGARHRAARNEDLATLPKVLLAIAAAAVAVSAPAFAADVTVRVSGVADGAGAIRVSACTEAEFLKTCRLVASAPARPGSVALVLRAVPPGRYAVQVFHDRDGNGRLDANLLGVPTEPYGFSRSPRMRFGPPAFADAAIEVDSRPLAVPVALRS